MELEFDSRRRATSPGRGVEVSFDAVTGEAARLRRAIAAASRSEVRRARRQSGVGVLDVDGPAGVRVDAGALGRATLDDRAGWALRDDCGERDDCDERDDRVVAGDDSPRPVSLDDMIDRVDAMAAASENIEPATGERRTSDPGTLRGVLDGSASWATRSASVDSRAEERRNASS
jgi:hypothetical protein